MSIMDVMLTARGFAPSTSTAPHATPPGPHDPSTAPNTVATNVNTAPPTSPAQTPEYVRTMLADSKARDTRDIAAAAAAKAAATASANQLGTLTDIMTAIVARLPAAVATPPHAARVPAPIPRPREQAPPPTREQAPPHRAHTAENLCPQFDATANRRAPPNAPDSDQTTMTLKRMMRMAGLVYVNRR